MNTLKQDKDKLFPLLQTAMELELLTIPPYLTAWLSIKTNSKQHENDIAADIIHSVMMDEMWHMKLVGNLISSLGGKVYLSEKNIPSYPLKMNFEDRRYTINLAAFSEDTIFDFLEIEKPHDVSTDWGSGFDEKDIPAATIGEFYDDITKKLNDICHKFGEEAVFCGDPSNQIGKDEDIITDKKTADQALQRIINEGEGNGKSIFIEAKDNKNNSVDTKKLGHFFRFKVIYHGRYYKITDTRQDLPSGKRLDVDYEDVYPIKTNAKSSDYNSYPEIAKLNDEFNREYSLMLTELEKAFNGTPEARKYAVKYMHSMVGTAKKMMSLTIISDDGNKICGTPSFEWNLP